MNIPALMNIGDTAPERLREAMSSDVSLVYKPVTPASLYRALVGSGGRARPSARYRTPSH